MMDLEERLKAGPLEVRSLWSDQKTMGLGRKVLERRRRRFFVRAGASVLSCVVLVLLAVWTGASHRAPETVQSGGLARVDSRAPRVLSLADGSKAHLVSPDAELGTESDRAERVSLQLFAGTVHFDVVARAERTFEITSGNVRVRVVGTAFTLRRLGTQTEVAVDVGRVQVSWPDGEKLLGKGERGVFPPDERRPPTPAPAASDTALEAAPAAGVPLPLGWRELARQRQYERAYVELFERHAGKPADDPADLLLAADVARLSRHPADAVAPLQKIVRNFAGDSRAPVAGFTLGRVLLDDLGRAGEAAEAFARARSLAPSGPLALDALAREIEARSRAGERERARALAQDYLRKYPEGRHAAKLQKMLDGQ